MRYNRQPYIKHNLEAVTMVNKSSIAGLTLTLILLLVGCYRVPVPQGNSLSARSVGKIAPGMTSAQVVSILGTPVINNTFASNQLVYVYSYKAQTTPLRIKRVFVFFEHDQVVRVTTSNNQTAP